MSRLAALLLATVLVSSADALAWRQSGQNSAARPVRSSKSLKWEASGLAASARPGRLWTHNDSGQPILFALDTVGGHGARARDRCSR